MQDEKRHRPKAQNGPSREGAAPGSDDPLQDQVEDAGRQPLSKLHLDNANPRLGSQSAENLGEIEVLDVIVNTYGIDDVLSSLAVNGYFSAEPLVGVRMDEPGGDIRIAEGNRRLAACLILAGDKRARNHTQRTREYRELQKKHNRPAITEIPVRVHAGAKSLLSYLGVRHIAASQPWDSFAKAAWVAKVLEAGDLSLSDVSQMIGDQHGTVARSLEGFYFVNQLIKSARFNPTDSLRPGRGSNPDYPFSWVYTALGYGPIREWLKMPDQSQGKKTPIENTKENLDNGGELLSLLFGNKSKSRQPAISDSRQIAELARAVADTASLQWLKRGKDIGEVTRLLKPARERVADGLFDAQQSLQEVLAPLSQGEIRGTDAAGLVEQSKKVKNVASEINNKIVGLAGEHK